MGLVHHAVRMNRIAVMRMHRERKTKGGWQPCRPVELIVAPCSLRYTPQWFCW
jgi:hypothetical protein